MRQGLLAWVKDMGTQERIVKVRRYDLLVRYFASRKRKGIAYIAVVPA